MNRRQAHYDEFEASELFCSKCRQAQPVRKRLLLVLPQGNKYDYVCSVCGDSVGSKMDDDRDAFSVLRPK
ncbi:MAG: cytoplasmic protein [bacterium]|nr:cytoplasmic protein [bacterium]